MKMERRFLLIVVSAIFFYSCVYDVVNYEMLLINKSNKEISLLYSNDVFPELNENEVAYYLGDQSVTQPDSSRVIFKPGGKSAWHDYIEKGEAKRLYLYVFETDTLRKYNNDLRMHDLVERRKFIRALSYTEDELKKINWKIIIN
jgi:hypothetical protein